MSGRHSWPCPDAMLMFIKLSMPKPGILRSAASFVRPSAGAGAPCKLMPGRIVRVGDNRWGWLLWLTGQAAVAVLLADSVFLKGGAGLPVPGFWASIAAMDLAVLGQSIIWWRSGPLGATVAQVCGLQAALSLLVVGAAPYGLYGGDAHFDYSVARLMREEGYPVPTGGLLPRAVAYSHWPGLHVIAAAVGRLGGIDLLQAARYLPVILTASTPLTMFMALRRGLGHQGPALLGALLVTQVPWAVTTHSQFIRETAAFPLFLATVFLLACREWRAAVLSTLAAVLTHHLTSLLTLVLWPLFALLHWWTSRSVKGSLPHVVFALIAASAWVVWVLTGPEPARRAVLESLGRVGEGIVSVATWHLWSPFTSMPRREDALRLFSSYGKQAVGALMGTLAVVWWVRRVPGRRTGAHAGLIATLSLAISGWMFLSHYVGMLTGSLNPARLASYGLWGLAGTFADELSGPHQNSSVIPRLGAVACVALLMATFMAEFPSELYRSDRVPQYAWGMPKWGQTAQLYSAAYWQQSHIPAGWRLAGDASTLEVMGGLYQRPVVLDAAFFRNGGNVGRWEGAVLRDEMRRLAYFSWTLQEGYRFFPIGDELWEELLRNSHFNLVYDNGDIRMLARRK